MTLRQPSIEIDGSAFASLEEFFSHFSEQALGNASWGQNLDAFNDVLRGGFGTPEPGFQLIWKNHHVSRARLGYAQTVRQLEKRLQVCHPENQLSVRKAIESARAGKGDTVFEWLVDIIRDHGPGGQECDDKVILVLG